MRRHLAPLCLSLLSLSSLLACGPASPRQAGESWSTRQTVDLADNSENPDPPPSTTVFFVESVDVDGNARVSVFKGEDHAPLGGALILNPDGQVIAYVGGIFCHYEKPFAWVGPSPAVGVKWTLDNQQNCNPMNPATVTGSAEVVAREKLTTVIGDLDVLKIAATRRTTSNDSVFEESATIYWSIEHELEVKISAQWAATQPSNGRISKSSSETELSAYTAPQ